MAFLFRQDSTKNVFSRGVYSDIFQKVGELIDESFRTANVDNITNDSSSDSDIAIGEP